MSDLTLLYLTQDMFQCHILVLMIVSPVVLLVQTVKFVEEYIHFDRLLHNATLTIPTFVCTMLQVLCQV
jgi:hypothetical protein